MMLRSGLSMLEPTLSYHPAASSYAAAARPLSPSSTSNSSPRFCLCVAARRKLPLLQ